MNKDAEGEEQIHKDMEQMKNEQVAMDNPDNKQKDFEKEIKEKAAGQDKQEEKKGEDKEDPANSTEKDTSTQNEGGESTIDHEESKDDATKTEEQEKAQAELTQKMTNMVEQAQKFKDEGNELFKEGELKKARYKYVKVFAYTKTLTGGGPNGGDGMVDMALKASQKGEIDADLKKKAKDIERDVNSNMAMVFIKEKNWSKAVEKATNSLNLEKTVKGYFRRGTAYAMKNDYENAYKDFEAGKQLDPESTGLFDKEIEKTRKREKEYDKKTSQKYAGFFSN